MKKKVVKKSEVEQDERDNYIRNRTILLNEFNDYLIEVKKDKPSIGDKINGLDSQQFATRAIFRLIVEQEEFIFYAKKSKLRHVEIEEENNILKQMIKDTKKIFKKDYQKYYDLLKKESVEM